MEKREEILNKDERIDDLLVDNLKLIQNKNYFLFGMDSVLLSSIVKSKSSNTIIDLCTGSAVIPILLTSRIKYSKIIGIELQEEMHNLAKRNVKLNNLEKGIEIIKEDIRNYTKIINILKQQDVNKVDIVVCNPPYKQVGTGTINDKTVKYIARHEEYCTLDDVFKTSSKLLKEKGKLYLVHKPERIADLITKARKYKLEVKEITIMQPKINKKASLVLLEYSLGGGNEAAINPIIIEYDDSGEYTSQIKKIYRMW